MRVRVRVRRHVRAVRAGVDAQHRARALAQHLHAEVEQRDLVERAVLLLQPVRRQKLGGRQLAWLGIGVGLGVALGLGLGFGLGIG